VTGVVETRSEARIDRPAAIATAFPRTLRDRPSPPDIKENGHDAPRAEAPLKVSASLPKAKRWPLLSGG
jgi:hypothetical protein